MEKPLSFDRVADVYDQTRGLPDDVMACVIEKITDVLYRFDCRLILDIGVGSGRFAKPLQDAGFQVVGIDVSQKMLNLARSKSVTDILLGDARCLPFRDESVDASMSMHVLHLIRDWKGVLSEIKRVTRKIYFSVIRSWAKGESLIELYDEMLIASGWKEIHPGIRERDLAREKVPFAQIPITRNEWTQEVNKEIIYLERRSYSSQWSVPDEIHQDIIRELKERYGGMVLRREEELSIAIWRPDDF